MTKQQIVDVATQIVNNTSATFGTFAQTVFDLMLDRIYTEFDWPFMMTNQTLTFATGVGSAAIATNYQAQFHAKWIDSSVSPAQERDLVWKPFEEWVQIGDPTRTDHRPTHYTINPGRSLNSSGAVAKMLIYPTFATSDSVKFYYYKAEAFGLATTAVPMFPNHAFLVDALVNELYKYANDPRHNPAFIEAFHVRVSKKKEDTGIVGTERVRLDPGVFKHPKMRSHSWPWNWW